MGTQLHLLPGNPIQPWALIPRRLGIVAWRSRGPSPSPPHLHVCSLCPWGSLGLLPVAARKAGSQALCWSGIPGQKLPGWLRRDFNIFWRGVRSPSPQACSSLPGNLLLYSSELLPLKAPEFAAPLWKLMREADTQERKKRAPEP